jgi:hypothetical protein
MDVLPVSDSLACSFVGLPRVQLEDIAGKAVERMSALLSDDMSPVDRAWVNVWHAIAEAAMSAQHVKTAAVQTA